MTVTAAVRPHCILTARDLETLAFVIGLCRWSANIVRLSVVYFRMAHISFGLQPFTNKIHISSATVQSSR